MGRGGATTFSMDMQFADAVIIMGSNMAECHPVAFRWVMKAKTKGGKLIHADPRFTRTSAMANLYAPLRAGSDIVFLGALIRQALEMHDASLRKPADRRDARERFFHDYLVRYTNAAVLVSEEVRDTEEAEGLFSGYDPARSEYAPRTWRCDTEPSREPSPQPERGE